MKALSLPGETSVPAILKPYCHLLHRVNMPYTFNVSIAIPEGYQLADVAVNPHEKGPASCSNSSEEHGYIVRFFVEPAAGAPATVKYFTFNDIFPGVEPSCDYKASAEAVLQDMIKGKTVIRTIDADSYG